MTTRAIQVLETASEKVARMMTATGVTVQFHPACKIPCADPKTLSVVLPPLPEKLTDEEEAKLRGALDHEVAHILFTKSATGTPENLGKLAGTMDGHILNAVEDGRVNRLISDRFIGSGENILTEGRMIFQKHAREYRGKIGTMSEKDKVASEQWIALMRAVEKHVFRNGEDITAPMGPTRFDDTISPSLKAQLEAVETLEDVKACVNPIKVWLFGSLEDAKKAESDAREEAEKGKSGKSGSKSGSGKKGSSSGSEKSEKDEKDASDDSTDEDGDSAGDDSEESDGEKEEKKEKKDTGKKKGKEKGKKEKAEAGEEDGETPEDGDEDGEGSGDSDEEGEEDSDATGDDDEDGEGSGDDDGDEEDDEEGDDEGEGSGSDDGEEEGEEGSDGEGSAGGRAPEDGDADSGEEEEGEAKPSKITVIIDEENARAFVAVMVKGEADKAEFLEIPLDRMKGETRYYVDTSTDVEAHIKDVAKYSRHGGMIDPDTLIEGKRLFSGLNDKVAALRGRLVMDLQSIGRKWERNLESGTLDTGALHRPFVGDPRVFVNRIKRQKVNTAVTMLQDCSSSMYGAEFDTSIQLAALFCDALEMANVPCEVLGFTTHYTNKPKFGIRGESLLHVIFKAFNERALSHRNEWYAMNDLLGQNVDGEGVLWAAKRLVVRPERRKVLFVLSDGIPMAAVGGRGKGGVPILHSHLRDSVRAAELAGIEVIGVGIKTDAPRLFYRRHVIYNDLDDLMTGFYSGVASLLRGGPGLAMAV